MIYLLTIVWYILIIVLVVGLIKPVVILRLSKKPTRGKIAVIFTPTILIFTFIIGAISPKQTSLDIQNKKSNTITQGFGDKDNRTEDTLFSASMQALENAMEPENTNNFQSQYAETELSETSHSPDELRIAIISLSFIETEHHYKNFKDKYQWAANRGTSPAIEKVNYVRDTGHYPLMEWSKNWMAELKNIESNITDLHARGEFPQGDGSEIFNLWIDAIYDLKMMRRAWWASPDGTGNYSASGSIREYEDKYLAEIGELRSLLDRDPVVKQRLTELESALNN